MLDKLLDKDLVFLSYEIRGRKPSERLFRQAVAALDQQGLAPNEVLHVGTSIPRDLVPARRLGMRTALFAGDRTSLQATAEQLKEATGRPDVLLTDLSQIAEIVRRFLAARGQELSEEWTMPPELHLDPSQLDLSRQCWPGAERSSASILSVSRWSS